MEQLAKCSCLEEFILRSCTLRRKEMAIDTENFTYVIPSDKHAWAKIFVEYFLSNVHCVLQHCPYQSVDDMLWYVPLPSTSYGSGSRTASSIQVYRRHSKKLPSPGCKSINWEETVYLNFILHHLEFTLTCAVCTKTSPNNLQILKKSAHKLFASPSRRRMDLNKCDSEEITYPHIYFSVDSYEQIFEDIVVRDGECVCVELSAKDKTGKYESVIFLGSIRYEVLRQVYDTKGSSTWQWAHKFVTSPSRRLEFVRMRGPKGKGYAEMAVAKLQDSQCNSMTASCISGYGDTHALQAVSEYHRRHSNTNLASRSLVGSPSLSRNFLYNFSPVKRSESDANTYRHYPEVEANTLDDEFEENSINRLWSVRGFGQAWHWLREKKRATCEPLSALLTYITLPWVSIVEDLLDNPIKPILTFENSTV